MDNQIYYQPINSQCEPGQVFGSWKVISFDHSERGEKYVSGKLKKFVDNFWLCECQCKFHTRSVLDEKRLRYGKTTRCRRCSSSEGSLNVTRSFNDLSGTKVGYLEVIKPHKFTEEEKEFARLNNKKLQFSYDCACNRCGKGIYPRTDYVIITGSHIKEHIAKRPDTASCGCMKRDMLKNGEFHKTHGMTGTRIHGIWTDMKARCYNPNREYYDKYGGRGITVCDEWKNSFQAFYDWAMSNGYTDELTIDRIDYDGNYEPSNCRWATLKQQANNMSTNHIIKLGYKEYTMSEVADMSCVNYTTYKMREYKCTDWSENDKLFIPPVTNQYGRDNYRKEHGIVDVFIPASFDKDNTERLTKDQIVNLLNKAPLAKDVLKYKN